MRHVFLPLIAALFLLPFSASAALTPQSRNILDEAKKLGNESEAEAGLKALKERPRKDVLKALADGLKAGEPFAGDAAYAAAALNAGELTAELKNTAISTDNWKVFAALRAVAKESDRAAIQALFLTRVSQVGAPSAVAILEALGAWNVALSDKLYEQLRASTNGSIKRAAVYQFLVARAAYSEKQQVEHFNKSFSMKPYQLRLESMQTFTALPTAERMKLKSAVGAQTCVGETRPEVQAACVKLKSSVKGDAT